MEVTTIGLDLAKNVFQLHGVDASGKACVSRRLRRRQVLPFFANLPPCLVGMEAQAASNHWARELIKLGHEVRLISPQFVKPYVRGYKNDANDAAAICEAVARPNMHFVTVKTIEQQDVKTLHAIRRSLVRDRTAKTNQIRGLLAEYGIVVQRGPRALRKQLPRILEDASNALTPLARELFADAYRQLIELNERVAVYDRRVKAVFDESPACQALASVAGVGPLTATAIVASVGNAAHFKNGRQMAAWLGLVPRQHSSGERRRLMGISKRGNGYLRTLMVHGARNVVRYADGKQDPTSRWVNAVRERRGANKAAVALANRNARKMFALLREQAQASTA